MLKLMRMSVLCPSVGTFKTRAQSLGFRVNGNGERIALRKGKVLGHFVCGGRHRRSSIVIDTATLNAGEDEAFNAIADLQRAFPSASNVTRVGKAA